MNRIIIFTSVIIFLVLVNLGLSTKQNLDELKGYIYKLQVSNLDMEGRIKEKGCLPKLPSIRLSTEYRMVLNQIKLMDENSEISMNVQLEGGVDSQDVSCHFENTEYKGIRGLRIKIITNRFSKETDMSALLDEINLLEKNMDFVVSEISKNNDNLTVKGEVYGI